MPYNLWPYLIYCEGILPITTKAPSSKSLATMIARRPLVNQPRQAGREKNFHLKKTHPVGG